MESHDVGNSYQDPVDYPTGKNDPGRDINQVKVYQSLPKFIKVYQSAVYSANQSEIYQIRRSYAQIKK